VRALKYLSSGGESTAINLGNGVGHSIRDILRAVKQVSGRDVPAQFQTRRAGDPAILVAKAEKARTVLVGIRNLWNSSNYRNGLALAPFRTQYHSGSGTTLKGPHR